MINQFNEATPSSISSTRPYHFQQNSFVQVYKIYTESLYEQLKAKCYTVIHTYFNTIDTHDV